MPLPRKAKPAAQSVQARKPGKSAGSKRRSATSSAPKKPATARTSRTSPSTRRVPAATAPSVQTVSFVSLGCPKNLVDSEKMLGLLAEDGLAIVSADLSGTGANADANDPGDGADAIVINTCGFLEASKEESLQVIHDAIRAKDEGRLKRVVVAGCLVQRHRAKLLEWAPGIDAMVGVFDRDHIVEAVRGEKAQRKALNEQTDQPKYWIAANALLAAKERGIKTVGLTVQGKDGKGVGYFEDDSARLRITPRHYAYLRVSEGCNQNCAFCTIPSIRGKMRSKPLDRIGIEARELVRDGAFELNLIGQDTTSYGDDIGLGIHAAKSSATAKPGDTSLFARGMPAMLRSVVEAFEREQAPGWVRLMYAYPSNFSDLMIDAITELSILSPGAKKRNGAGVLPYIDIPLQHASDRVLGAMRRNVTSGQQRALMRKLRERIPGMAIRTTFISGFPGETEDDHQRLLEFVEEVGFDALGVFEYSHEEGTVAGTMEEDPKLAVPEDVKARRRGEVMGLQQRLAFERNKSLASQFKPEQAMTSGARFDVLIDRALPTTGRATSGVSKAGRLHEGRTYAQAPQVDSVTFVHSTRALSPGEVVRCVIVDADGYDLIARPVDELERRVGLKVVG